MSSVPGFRMLHNIHSAPFTRPQRDLDWLCSGKLLEVDTIQAQRRESCYQNDCTNERRGLMGVLLRVAPTNNDELRQCPATC